MAACASSAAAASRLVKPTAPRRLASGRAFFAPGAGRLARNAVRRAASARSAASTIVCEKVVGIDLGTTNSAVAAMEGGKPAIVANAEGGRTTPSVVAYTKRGERLVGQVIKKGREGSR